jgi:GntR family transcriptional repressor for pyruvate dehydrogenase complex
MTSVQLKPIATQHSRVDEVATQLRNFVETGGLEPGARLPSETELSEQLCISRNVLREAIKRLESIGLLSVRRGLGTFVGDRGTLSATAKLVRSAMAISPKDVTKVAEFRRAIEIDAVRRAAAIASDQDIADLQAIYNEMTASGDKILKMELDFKFHLRIVEITDNLLMRNVMEVIQEFIYAGMVQTLPVEADVPTSRDHHRDTLDAIQAHDPDRAEQAMRAHMELLVNRLDRAEQIDERTLKEKATQSLKSESSLEGRRTARPH